ncbi:MAG: transporter C-terminal domain [Bacteroidota bacterium]
MESRKAAIEQELATHFDNYEQVVKLTAELEQLKTDLDEKGMRWLELSDG